MDIDEARESVETHDTNKDGKVTWSEYYGKMQGDMPEKDPEDNNFEDVSKTFLVQLVNLETFRSLQKAQHFSSNTKLFFLTSNKIHPK